METSFRFFRGLNKAQGKVLEPCHEHGRALRLPVGDLRGGVVQPRFIEQKRSEIKANVLLESTCRGRCTQEGLSESLYIGKHKQIYLKQR